MSLLFDAAGLLGVACYIGSYGALQSGLIGGRSYAYILGNMAAASFILI